MNGGHRLVRLSLLLTLLMASGCAYYNTFYFAKKYYSQGERLRESSTTETISSPEAAKRYDKAIVQCRKVLNFHAQSRWADDALFLMGASYYGKASYDSALIVFEDLQRSFPNSAFMSEAIFKRGLCHYERGDYEQMTSDFEMVLAREPDFEHEDDILYTLARRAEREGDRTAAVRSYRRLVDRYAGSKRGEDGLLQIGRLYFEDQEYDSARVSYEELVLTTKDQENYQEGQIQLVQCLIRLGRAGEAITRLEDQIPRNLQEGRTQETEYAARVRIALAQAHNRAGTHEKALENLRIVTEKYGETASKGEAAYLIGYTYESYMDSLAAAETAYEAAVNMSARASSFRDLARGRLTNLKRLIALSGQAASTGDAGEEKAAEAVLKIAELQYFSQDETEQALVQYQSVIDRFPETSIAPRAAYAIAWIHTREEGLPADTAQVRLRRLVARYPASEQARAAIDLLQSSGGDTTGLRALLVEAAPETVAVVAAPEDSLVRIDPRERLRPGLSRFVDEDAISVVRGDSSAITGDSLGMPGRAPVDPTRGRPRVPGQDPRRLRSGQEGDSAAVATPIEVDSLLLIRPRRDLPGGEVPEPERPPGSSREGEP